MDHRQLCFMVWGGVLLYRYQVAHVTCSQKYTKAQTTSTVLPALHCRHFAP
jgi:hypothetical protein